MDITTRILLTITTLASVSACLWSALDHKEMFDKIKGLEEEVQNIEHLIYLLIKKRKDMYDDDCK